MRLDNGVKGRGLGVRRGKMKLGGGPEITKAPRNSSLGALEKLSSRTEMTVSALLPENGINPEGGGLKTDRGRGPSGQLGEKYATSSFRSKRLCQNFLGFGSLSKIPRLPKGTVDRILNSGQYLTV